MASGVFVTEIGSMQKSKMILFLDFFNDAKFKAVIATFGSHMLSFQISQENIA